MTNILPFINLCPDPMLVIDNAGIISGANEHAVALLQYSHQELCGMSVDQLVPDQFRGNHRLHRDAFWAAPKVRSMGALVELSAKNKSGANIPVEISLGYIGDSSAPKFVVCTLRDVTERKHVERQLRESNGDLSATLNSIGEGVIVTDVAGSVVRINGVAERLLQVSTAEALGKPVDQILAQNSIHPISTLSYLGRNRRFILTRPVAPVAPHCILNVNAEPITIDGKITGTVLALHEITEQIEFEKRLVDAERQLADILDSLPNGVLIHNDGNIMYANHAFVEDLGFKDKSELLNQSLERCCPELVAAQLDLLHEALVRRQNGDSIILEVSAARNIQINAEAASLLVTRDITEQKELHAGLMKSDRLASIGLLAAGVAHEINNPLTYILANQQVALEYFDHAVKGADLLRDTDIREALVEASEGTERIRCIVDDLKLASGRAEEGMSDVVDLGAVMASSLRMVAFEIRHRARVSTNIEPGVTIIGNRSKIGQLFTNLLTNAAHAIPSGHAEINQIQILIERNEGCAHVEITDTGTGIEPAFLERIFDPFVTTKAAHKGTGLGLFISHNIVKAHGGKIFAKAGAGAAGTTFIVRFPPMGGVPAPAPASAAIEDTLPRLSILVVDDEPAICRLMQRMLSAHQVLCVSSGQAAILELEQGSRFDVILCDVTMPSGSGLDVFNYLRLQQSPMLSGFTFVTGETFHREPQRALPAPVLEKPFSSAELLTSLRAIWRLKTDR